jgi:hypothetical protein
LRWRFDCYPLTPLPVRSLSNIAHIHNRLIVIGVVGNQARKAGKTINLKLESSSFPNQLGTAAHKRVITSLTADELKYTNPTATAGGQIHQAWKRAATVATN